MRKYKNVVQCFSGNVNFHFVVHVFCSKLALISQIFEKFFNFLQISPFSLYKLGLCMKILVYSNKDNAIVTILAKNFVL